MKPNGTNTAKTQPSEIFVATMHSSGRHANKDTGLQVLYTSDHGSHFCTRNSEYKRSCHEASIRIPMVIEGPGFSGVRVTKELISLLDLPPTILSAAGIPAPDTMRGRALQPLIAGTAVDWRQDVFMQISEDHIGRAIRTERWKYEVWVPSDRYMSGWGQPGSDIYHEHHLYDLQNDPFEKRDLVSDPAYVVVRTELAVVLKRRMVEAGEREPVILPDGKG